LALILEESPTKREASLKEFPLEQQDDNVDGGDGSGGHSNGLSSGHSNGRSSGDSNSSRGGDSALQSAAMFLPDLASVLAPIERLVTDEGQFVENILALCIIRSSALSLS